MPKYRKELSDLQAAFCREYIKDFCGAGAAVRAGYTKKSSRGQAADLLARAYIQAEIKRLTEKIESKLIATKQQVLEEISNLAMSNFNKILIKLGKKEPLTEWEEKIIAERTVTRTQGGGSIKFKAHDKTKPLEMMAKYHKLLTEHVEHTGPDGGPIKYQDVPTDELKDKLEQLRKRRKQTGA